MRIQKFLPLILSLLIAVLHFSACQKPENPPLHFTDNSVKTEILFPKKEPFYPKDETDVWDFSDVSTQGVHAERKLIAFSFDDAPSSSLENLLAVFAAYNAENPDCVASATIFCNSVRFDENTPHLLHTALALNMELGNHTHSHFDLTKLSQELLAEEIETTDSLLYRIDGKRTHLLRAPFGRLNERVKQAASAPWIDWSIDTLDWTGASEQDIYDRVFTQKFPGAIVLMHDGYPHTRYALKRLLPDLKKAGYQVVSVSALAKMHDCKLRFGKVYIRARKAKDRTQ